MLRQSSYWDKLILMLQHTGSDRMQDFGSFGSFWAHRNFCVESGVENINSEVFSFHIYQITVFACVIVASLNEF